MQPLPGVVVEGVGAGKLLGKDHVPGGEPEGKFIREGWLEGFVGFRF